LRKTTRRREPRPLVGSSLKVRSLFVWICNWYSLICCGRDHIHEAECCWERSSKISAIQAEEWETPEDNPWYRRTELSSQESNCWNRPENWNARALDCNSWSHTFNPGSNNGTIQRFSKSLLS
jgi:hypothetical protein